jgi:hypothetical protein
VNKETHPGVVRGHEEEEPGDRKQCLVLNKIMRSLTMNISTVGQPSPDAVTFRYMKEFIMERRHSHKSNVKKSSDIIVPSPT